MGTNNITPPAFKSQRGEKWLPVVNRPGRAIGVLFGTFFMMLILLSLVSALLFGANGDGMTTKGLRIISVAQDLFVFILPAILAAFVATRLPASLLAVDVKPRLMTVFLAVVVMVTSLPAMEWLIDLNNSIHFPESLSWLEDTLRGMEDSASSGIESISGGTSVGDLIISILIIGILTGIAEEMFFRGALQNLFMSMPRVNKHLAIWIAAFIFSFMHFQFFGFFPRLLLGAYFGYLIWWSGSLWVPIIAHAFNNTMVVVLSWIAAQGGTTQSIEEASSLSVGNNPATIILSIIVTVLGIIILRRNALRNNSHYRNPNNELI